MKKILIYVDGYDAKSAMGLLGVVERVYDMNSVETYAFYLQADGNDLLQAQDFTFLVDASKTDIQPWEIQKITDALEELQEAYGFDMVLFPATVMGRSIAPRLAMRMQTGLVADVTDVSNEDGKITMVRPAFDGKILAWIQNTTNPVMMSVRPDVFRYLPKGNTVAKRVEFVPKKKVDYGISFLGEKEKTFAKDIRKSEVLVSGGGGVKAAFAELSGLAEQLGGMVAASRSIVDSGIARRTIQVGQSGKTVSPRLYMALGIYGSLQHIEGLKDVETIIAVNTDRYAPICSLAELVVEGDAEEFIKKMVARIEKDLE